MQLERRLGLWDVVAISISTMLGSGIFLLPGMAAALTGPSIWLAYLLAAVCVLPATLSKAELGTAMPAAGGTYVYVERAFGPLIGTIAGFGLWLSLLLKSAFALVGFAAYLNVFMEFPVVPVALGLLILIAMLNMRGVNLVSQVQKAVVLISVAGLLFCALAALPEFELTRFDNSFPRGMTGVVSAAALVFVSYAGVTKIAAIAEEVKDPDRNLPAGMIIALSIAASLYALTAFVLSGTIPQGELATDIRPIYTLGQTAGGAFVGGVIAVLAVFTMTSMANGGLLAASRFPFSMSRDQLLPEVLNRVHSAWRTPVPAILVTAVFMVIAITTLDLEKIAKLASAFMIVLFIGVNGTLIVLRESRMQWYRPSYRAPFYPWLQVFGMLTGVVLLALLGPSAILASIVVGAVGAVFFFGYARRRAPRKGVFGLIGRRQDLLVHPDANLIEPMDHSLDEDAAVVVPIMGHERSPEMLVEVGSALADGRRVEVLQLTEVPEQSVLVAVVEDEGAAHRALTRRVTAMAAERQLDVHFNDIVTRDRAHTIHASSARFHCEWLVMEWRGRALVRRHIVRDPMGWLLDNLDCNLALFRDAGVRYIREIFVYAEPGPHDALVVSTADQLARIHGARLTFVRFVSDDASEVVAQSTVDYLQELRGMCIAETSQTLVRGRARLDALVRATASYDLMVMGATVDVSWRTRIFGDETESLIDQAACSVLTLKTPRSQTHEAFDRQRMELGAEAFNVLDFIHRDAVRARVSSGGKDSLFSLFAEAFARALPGAQAREIYEALWVRERTQSTAVGLGLAIPHASLPGLDRSHVGIFTTDHPIDYQAPDNEPVDVFFVSVGPPRARQVHLLLLSDLSRMVLETDVLEAVRVAESDEAVHEVVVRCAGCLRAPPGD